MSTNVIYDADDGCPILSFCYDGKIVDVIFTEDKVGVQVLNGTRIEFVSGDVTIPGLTYERRKDAD